MIKSYVRFSLWSKLITKIGSAIVASHHTLAYRESKEYLPQDFDSEIVQPERPPSYSVAV